MFWKKKKKTQNMIDTSIEAYRELGINLTKEQFEDLVCINLMANSEECKTTPTHWVMLLFKYLNILPPELVCEVSDNESADDSENVGNDVFQKRYGKLKY